MNENPYYKKKKSSLAAVKEDLDLLSLTLYRMYINQENDNILADKVYNGYINILQHYYCQFIRKRTITKKTNEVYKSYYEAIPNLKIYLNIIKTNSKK